MDAMDLNINNLMSTFTKLKYFYEAFWLSSYFIQPHVIHTSILPKNTWSDSDDKSHSHRTYEFSLPIYGIMKYYIGEKIITLNAGDMVIIPADVKHRRYAEDDSCVFSIMLFISCHGDKSQKNIRTLNESIKLHNYKILHAGKTELKIKEILEEAQNKAWGFDNKILCLSREFYIELFRQLHLENFPSSEGELNLPPKHGDTTTSIVELVAYYVHDNITRTIKISDVSNYIGISSNHLNRIFKAKCGRTIQVYISSCKVQQSCKLLQSTNHSVKNIAALVGFNDVNYFCQVFKKHTGMTPSQFRQKNPNVRESDP